MSRSPERNLVEGGGLCLSRNIVASGGGPDLAQQALIREFGRMLRSELEPILQNLTQGSKSVEDYYNEVEVAMIQVDIEEDQVETMARFLAGLNRDIANVVELQHFVKIVDMVHMTINVEK
ncbi:hypothetical protein PVK06_039991 [Gossypium arboreum]|uniref:Retrotransposon gag domain-containing protein n=1 Tax=Gossypium arboreum TaxID=29729 RepID=A0ABR0N4A9_GOSAR|nr:hypothetical protein PVK06_039991 [Gossypium arboreum]